MKNKGDYRVKEKKEERRKRLKSPASIYYFYPSSGKQEIIFLHVSGNIFEGFGSKNKGDICKLKKITSVFNY